MKSILRRIVVHLIVQSFLRAGPKGKKAIAKNAIKLALRRLR